MPVMRGGVIAVTVACAVACWGLQCAACEPADVSCYVLNVIVRVFADEATAVIQHLPSLEDEGAAFFEAASAGNVAVQFQQQQQLLRAQQRREESWISWLMV